MSGTYIQESSVSAEWKEALEGPQEGVGTRQKTAARVQAVPGQWSGAGTAVQGDAPEGDREGASAPMWG